MLRKDKVVAMEWTDRSANGLKRTISSILTVALVCSLIPLSPVCTKAEELDEEAATEVVVDDAVPQEDVGSLEGIDDVQAIEDEQTVANDEVIAEEVADAAQGDEAVVVDEAIAEGEVIPTDEAVAADETEAVATEEAVVADDAEVVPADEEVIVSLNDAESAEKDGVATEAPAEPAANEGEDDGELELLEGSSQALLDGVPEDEGLLALASNSTYGYITDNGTWGHTVLYDSADDDQYWSSTKSTFTLKHRSRVEVLFKIKPSRYGNGFLRIQLVKVGGGGESYVSETADIDLNFTTQKQWTWTYNTNKNTPSIPAGTYEFRCFYHNKYDWGGNIDLLFNLNIPNLFNDVPKTHWAAGVIADAVDKGMMSGYAGNKTFGLNDSITRGQVATVLWNLEGKPSGGRNPFRDVASGKYYAKAVAWAASNGVVSGYKDGTFRPDKQVTREELATMIRNYAVKYKGMSKSGSSASEYAAMRDGYAVSPYARAGIGWCFRRGIMSGSNGRINPQGTATRAQAAKMFVMLAKLMGK